MIDTNELRRLALDGDLAAMQEIILRLEAAEKERDNANAAAAGVALHAGAMQTRLEAAESEAIEQARLSGMGSEREAALMAKLEAAEKERDSLRADKATLQQMTYSLKDRLEVAEKSDAESIAMYRKARDERDNLRAKIERMERQEPAYWGPKHAIEGGSTTVIVGKFPVNPTDAPLYALPGAKGEKDV